MSHERIPKLSNENENENEGNDDDEERYKKCRESRKLSNRVNILHEDRSLDATTSMKELLSDVLS